MRTVSLAYHPLGGVFYAVDGIDIFNLKRRREYNTGLDNLPEILIRDFHLDERKTVIYLADNFPKEVEENLREALSKRKTKVRDITRTLQSE